MNAENNYNYFVVFMHQHDIYLIPPENNPAWGGRPEAGCYYTVTDPNDQNHILHNMFAVGSCAGGDGDLHILKADVSEIIPFPRH